MPPITMTSIRFREQLLRSRLLHIDRLVKDGEIRLTLSTPLDSKVNCTLGLSTNPRPKVFSDPFGLIRLVDSWGLPQVAVPLDISRSTTEISETACAKIDKVLRSPRTRSRRGANRSDLSFPLDWGGIGDAIGRGQSDDQIAGSTGIPLDTVRFIRAQLRRTSGRINR